MRQSRDPDTQKHTKKKKALKQGDHEDQGFVLLGPAVESIDLYSIKIGQLGLEAWREQHKHISVMEQPRSGLWGRLYGCTKPVATRATSEG